MLNMMRFLLQLFLAHVLLQGTFSFEEICNEHCGNTFSLHTLDKVESNIACLRGCRLSKITQMSTQSREKDVVISMCSNDCKRAYINEDLKYACHVGCKYQVMLPSPKPTHQEETDWLKLDSSYYFPSSIHSGFSQPVVMIKQCWRKMMDKASDIVNIRSSYFFSHGNYIIIDFDASSSDGDGKKVPLNIYETLSDESNAQEKTNDGNLHHYAHKVYRNSWNWLNCVESKAGVPRWLLLSLLSVAVCGMVYMCCSSLIEAETILEKKYAFDRELTIDDAPLLELAPPKYEYSLLDAPPLYTALLEEKKQSLNEEQAEPLPEKKLIAIVDA